MERDLEEWDKPARELAQHSTADILQQSEQIGDIFRNGALAAYPGGPAWSSDEFATMVSRSTGLPKHMVLGHMSNIQTAWHTLSDTLQGLTRGLAPIILDGTKHRQNGRMVRIVQAARSLAVILPNNAPSVHGLWLPALALRTPVALKPGHSEPWTAYRIHAAWVEAGMPSSSISVYPTSHGAVPTLIRSADRAMVFGDEESVLPYRNRRDVQVHGPGHSKVVFGGDTAGKWSRYDELLDACVLYNGGRSCINTSTIVVPSGGQELAQRLAKRWAGLMGKALDDGTGVLAGFAGSDRAQALSDEVDRMLQTKGAVDCSAAVRPGGRVHEEHGLSFVLPTVIWADDPSHPLARCERPFPLVCVVEVPEENIPTWLGPSLSVTVVTKNADLSQRILNQPDLASVQIGNIPTTRKSWDQPHEGNLFELLCDHRAVGVAKDKTGRNFR
jgi:acyl-CoA reductase-like NAD-dependent aldehyde dehydrogenase